MLPNVFGELRPEFLRELGVSHFKMGRDCRVLVVTGENAAGKSFLRRVFKVFLAKRKRSITSYTFSMEARSRSNQDFNVLMSMAYGDENIWATSANTVHAIKSILNTSDSSEYKHALIIDEPEIGLSEETELAIGQLMASRLSADWPKLRAGVVVMTHSRHIVGALMGVPGAKFLNLHDRYPTVEEWIDREIVPTDLDTFDDDAMERFHRIGAMLKDNG